MNMKKWVALLMAAVLAVGMLAACGGGGGGKGDIMVCFSSDPETVDPALNSTVDGSTLIHNAFAGIYGWDKDSAGNPIVVPECAEALVEPTELPDGKFEYVFQLRDGLKWSDGEAMKASDFTYAWNRAVDPKTLADYQAIFGVIDGYDDVNPNLNISADDEANTVTVVTTAYCAYFDELMAFPTFFPVRQDIVEANPDGWATDVASYISNGPFKMSEWTVGSSIKYVKNEHYWNADKVKLDSLTFALSADDDANFVNFKNGTYKFLYNVPQQMIPEFIEERLGTSFFIGDYVGTYYIEFKVEKSLKPGLSSEGDTDADWADWTAEQNAEVRHALGLLIDRNYLVDVVMQSGETPASGFVATNMDDGTGTDFRSKAGDWWSNDPADKQANIDQALEILKKYYDYDEASGQFTNFPAFEFSMNPSTRNVMIVSAVQDMWGDYGIAPTIDQRDWAVITTALTEGDFTASRLGWIADYTDPSTFLEVYESASGNNHPRLGKDGPIGSGAYYGPNKDQTWKELYDGLLAGIKTESDLAARAELMYEAEEVLRDTYVLLPLFYYVNPYLVSEDLKEYIYSPLGWVNFKYAYMA